MEKTIKEYGKLTVEQKKEAVELFLIGFGRFMTFSGDEALKKTYQSKTEQIQTAPVLS